MMESGLGRKRDRGGNAEDLHSKRAKMVKMSNGDGETLDTSLPGDLVPSGFFDADVEQVLRNIQSASGMSSAEAFDETALRRMINALERKAVKNQEQRVKYADDPTKFMDSELELNDAVQELHIIATQPELNRIVVQMNTVKTLTQLLAHENTDISLAVIDLVQELTDVDTLTESFEDASILVDALLREQIVASLLQNMERLDESSKEESAGIHNTLSIFENLLEFNPDSAESFAKLGLLKWILKRLKAKIPFDANKLYASEILSILTQNSKENRKLLGELNGVDILLHQLAAFKRHDPSTAEEYEMMENLFDCLCSTLLFPANRKFFLDGEGLQLMNLMIREKKQSRNSAIKVLDFALSGDEGADLCTKFVEILGLRTVFPLFVKPPKQHKKRGLTQNELEEHLCAIIASLARNLVDQQRERFLAKFLENDLEKVERIMELHFQYADKIAATDREIEKEKSEKMENQEEIDDDMEDEFALKRLENGLFTLQRIDIILLEMYADADKEVCERIDRTLNMRGVSRHSIVSFLREYLAEIKNDGDPSKKKDVKRISQLIDRFLQV